MDSIEIESVMREKLVRYSLKTFEELTEKQKTRLLKIEETIQQDKIEIKRCIDSIKSRALSKSYFESKLGVTRKTLRSDPMINIYMEYSIDEDIDVFNTKRLKEQAYKYEEISRKYNQVMENLLDTSRLQSKIRDLRKKLKKSKVSEATKDIIIQEKREELELLEDELWKYKKNVIEFPGLKE